jgi:hypothetical protein
MTGYFGGFSALTWNSGRDPPATAGAIPLKTVEFSEAPW